MVLLVLALGGSLPGQRGRVNLNTAGVEELDSLPGIGPALAGRIIEFREKNGPFRRTEELMSVRGIGEKKFLKLRDRVIVTTSKASKAQKARPN